jgi:hypothetical protein
MAITLGEIAVRLTANTAEFISGFGAAGTTAKRFRAELSEAMGSVGEFLEKGLSQFGEFGEMVGGTLGRAASASGQAVLAFGKLGGSMGTVVGIGAGAVAGLAVLEGGLVGLAIHSAAGAAKLGEMSEKAGVSTQTMAGLALAGKGVGVETESLVKALGFMGANAVKAAISTDYAHTSFGRLGISIRDANGAIKDGGTLFTEVVGKIAALPTSEQGYFVKAIFGRGGIEILPLINKGVESINESMETAKKFGLGDSDTVAKAREFKEQVDETKAAFEGIALLAAKDLLPTLTYLVEELEKAGEKGDLKTLVHDMAELTRMTLGVGDTFKAVFETIGLYIEYVGRATIALFNAIGASIEAVEDAATGDFAGAKQSFTGAWGYLYKQMRDFDTQSRDIWQRNADFIDGIYGREKVNPFRGMDLSGLSGKQINALAGGHVQSSLPFNAQDILDSFKKKPGFDADLSTKGEGKEDTTLARIKERIAALQEEKFDWMATAAAADQAETIVAKATEKANEAFGKMRTEAARDKTGAAQKYVAENEALIKFQAASIFYSQTLAKTNEDLQKHNAELDEAIAAENAMAEAYKTGGAAIVSAGLDKEFAKQQSTINQLNQVMNASGAQRLLDAEKTKEQALASAKLQTELGREDATAGALKPKLDALNAAYLVSADAVRQANIELQVQRFIQDELDKKVVVSTQQIEQKRKILTEADKQAYDGALAQEAAQFNLATQYDNQIVRLQRIRELMQQNGLSTLGVEAQIFDEQNRLLHQWDEWAFKIGTVGQKFKAVMGELVIQGRQAGAAIMQAIMGAVDGIESQLAKLLTGQKTDFKGVFTGLAESVTKAEIQKGVGKLAEHFGIHLPGLTAKADGSQANPFYVVMANTAGFGRVGAAQSIPIFGTPILNQGEGGGGLGGFLGSLLGAFGGFHAMGGSIPSGKWGITGEHGPEIVTGPANVVPAGPTYNITHNHNYPNAGSRDLFGRTQKQNQERQIRNSRLAYA